MDKRWVTVRRDCVEWWDERQPESKPALDRTLAALASLEAEHERLRIAYSDIRESQTRLALFHQRVEKAHEEHLRTGDYAKLGMATQEALCFLARTPEGSEPPVHIPHNPFLTLRREDYEATPEGSDE